MEYPLLCDISIMAFLRVQGQLLFLIYINDIINDLQCNVSLFADDTSIQKCLYSHEDFKVINDDWLKLSIQQLVTFNALKTEYIIVSQRKTRAMHPDLLLNDTKFTGVNNHKHLGLTISNNMSWSVNLIRAFSMMIHCIC